MQTKTILKWSLAVVTILVVATTVVTYAVLKRGRYVGVPESSVPTVLVGARVYDPENDSVIDDAVVLIEGRTIVAVGPLVDYPDSARVLNVNGLTLLPGFIDSHIHMSGIRSRRDGSRELGWVPYLWKFLRRFPERRRALIEAGVTSVKSLGDPYPWIENLAARIERHELAGPRVFAAGPYLTAPGG